MKLTNCLRIAATAMQREADTTDDADRRHELCVASFFLGQFTGALLRGDTIPRRTRAAVKAVDEELGRLM